MKVGSFAMLFIVDITHLCYIVLIKNNSSSDVGLLKQC